MFDGNGNWTSDFSAQADRDNGIKILASRFDNIFIADIKESFENCLTKDGQITPIGNFNMGGQRITNLNNGVNDNDAVNMSQYNNAVHKTGDETITGNKTFTGGVYSNQVTLLKQGGISGGLIYFDKPDNTTLTGTAFIDIYGNLMRFVGKNSSNNYKVPLYLDLETGVAVATPSDAQNSVVTTTAISKGASGYVKLGNGMIIQWGKSTATSSSGYVTLPTPFASTDYAVIINDVMANVPSSQLTNANLVGWGVIQSRSTTSFTAFLCNYENSQWWRWGEGRSFTWIAIGY